MVMLARRGGIKPTKGSSARCACTVWAFEFPAITMLLIWIISPMFALWCTVSVFHTPP